MTDIEISFACMGTSIRIVAQNESGIQNARRYLEDFDRRLSRFKSTSELSRLNADLRSTVPASSLLRAAVAAALWAAQTTGGLVDPTIIGALERAGYGESMAGTIHKPLAVAIGSAPVRGPAGPDPASRWHEIEVDGDHGVIRRPLGIRIDTGGSSKGLAADAAALRLGDQDRFVIDCGGDLRVGGDRARERPFEVSVVNPLTGTTGAVLVVAGGGLATSGIDRRVWRSPAGELRHHLIDPATGRPAWTGLVGASALAPSALEADVLAKAALLSGPAGGRKLLQAGGGVLFHDDGRVEHVAPRIPLSALKTREGAAR